MAELISQFYLPDEIISIILSYLPFYTLATTASRVSRRWCKAGSSDILWLQLLLNYQGSPPKDAISNYKALFITTYKEDIRYRTQFRIHELPWHVPGKPQNFLDTVYLDPHLPLPKIKEHIFNRINELGRNTKFKIEDVTLLACVNGLFNTTIYTPIRTVVSRAAFLLNKYSPEYVDEILAALKSTGIVHTVQVFACSSARSLIYGPIRMRLDMAISILEVVGIIYAWVNLTSSDATLTLYRCGIRSAYLKMVTLEYALTVGKAYIQATHLVEPAY